MAELLKPPLFQLGHVVSTPGALTLFEDLKEKDENLTMRHYMTRHQSGDWGDLSQEDKNSNYWSLKNDERIFSAYETPAGKFWLITERDRSATTYLLPSEY